MFLAKFRRIKVEKGYLALEESSKIVEKVNVAALHNYAVGFGNTS